MSTTTVSEMSFIVSHDGGQQELSPHGKSSLVMNGSPRTSSHQPRLSSIDTSNNASTGYILPNGTLYHSPAASQQDSPTLDSRISSDVASHTYPPGLPAGSKHSTDQNLRVPSNSDSPNRRSLPARIPSDGSANVLSNSAPTASDSPLRSVPQSRLQHRHTLEVPRVAPARNSKDGPTRDSDDLPNGRISTSTPTRRRRGSMSALGRTTTRSYHSDLNYDGQSFEDDPSRLDAVRAKRASRRRRKEEEDDDRVLVGTKVDQHHANWVMAYNMLTGIRFTVSQLEAKPYQGLTDADFEAKDKFSFDITGNQVTPGVKYDFKFKDYAPLVFRHLRKSFNIDPAEYLISLTGKYILSELASQGKSGSFFYFSRDYKYIIKTIHQAEHVCLRRILKRYYQHVTKHPNTLLSQFYGLHRVKTPWSGRKIHFVVMNNLFPPHRDIHRTFDLKGSLLGRDFKEEDITRRPRATLKDQNWLRRKMHLELGPRKGQALIQQVEQDVELLKELRIMDYSMLIGIHDLERGNEERLRDKTLQVFQPGGDQAPNEDAQAPERLHRSPSTMESARKAKELRHAVHNQRPVPLGSSSSRMPDELPPDQRAKRYFYSDDGGFAATHEDGTAGDAIYYLGIIDCLTKYGTTKKTEHFFKALANRSRKHEISAVPPKEYGERFIKFMKGITKSKKGTDRVDSEKTDEEIPEQASVERVSQEAPDRMRLTMQDTDGTMTLPVVEEAGEASSTGGRSAHSSRSQQQGQRDETR